MLRLRAPSYAARSGTVPGGVLGGMNVPEPENGYLDRIEHRQSFLVSNRMVSPAPWPPP